MDGDGTLGYSGDGGSATSAEIFVPTDVVVNSKGDLIIVDYGNCRIREIGV